VDKALHDRIMQILSNPPAIPSTSEQEHAFEEFKQALNSGEIRAAERTGRDWSVNVWVKQGILLGFRMGILKSTIVSEELQFFDKHTYPLKRIGIDDGVRLVPGGSAIRDGVHLGRGITCMPPMYINVGAYVDDGTMIDSHALVGSCAQIGKRVHISAAAQIGGVLEPVGELPVIIEDDVLIGGNCGVYDGAIIRERAVLGAGTILTGGTPVYDLVRRSVYRREGNRPLEIPEGAVVVPGTRPVASGWGKDEGISLSTPVIVKYRDSKTETGIRLEDLLR
jgi:2,3,4,5-tetrahydropyridine-2,6-dicarboxylate N-succinyltransferase